VTQKIEYKVRIKIIAIHCTRINSNLKRSKITVISNSVETRGMMTQTWTSRLLELFLRSIYNFSGIAELTVIIILRFGNIAKVIKCSNKYLTHSGSSTPCTHQLNFTIHGYPLAVALGLHHIILHISIIVKELISHHTVGH